MLDGGSSARRVVVVDDSPLMRRLLSSALVEAGFDVVAVAKDGEEALAACRTHRPDVLSLDLAMPGMHGLDVLRNLQRQGSPTRVVVVSAFSPAYGARAVDALAEGAFDLVEKPSIGEPVDSFLAQLAGKMVVAANAAPKRVAAARPRPTLARSANGAKRTVVIACSTGGPRALAEVVPHLPAKLGNGTLIVQHMPPGFTGSLAQRLDRASSLTVLEAAGGERLDPGTALLAPGGSHLRVASNGAVSLSDEAAVGGLRPRADITIRDAAEAFRSNLLLVVLTGMGKDGLEGAKLVKQYGGRVLAEAESSCTVYGMPRAIVEADLADGVHELPALANAIAAEAA